MVNDTLAVIVIYNELVDSSESLNSLDKAYPFNLKMDVLVYDNSLVSQNVEKTKFSNYNFLYHHDPKNPGIGTAYNYGAEIALKMNKKWLLLLDQDTFFAQNFLEKMNEATINFSDIALFAPILKINETKLLSPCKFNFYGKHLKAIKFGRQLFEDNSPINSGILVKLEDFLEVGGYNNKVQLDLSDHQFIERFKVKHKSYVVINSIGLQNFSAIEDNKQKQLVRFGYYCQGVFNFETHITHKKKIMILFLVLKTFKKSVKYKTINFFLILFAQIRVYTNFKSIA